jgi:hypothetical protein
MKSCEGKGQIEVIYKVKQASRKYSWACKGMQRAVRWRAPKSHFRGCSPPSDMSEEALPETFDIAILDTSLVSSILAA